MTQKREAKLPVPESDNACGLTPEEQGVMDKLMECYELFLKMDREHPDEIRNFVDGVHKIQDILALRVIRRCYPQGWPTYDLMQGVNRI